MLLHQFLKVKRVKPIAASFVEFILEFNPVKSKGM